MPRKKVEDTQAVVKKTASKSKSREAGSDSARKKEMAPVESTVAVEKPLTTTKKATSTGSVSVDVMDMKGTVVETMNLPKAIFGEEVNEKLLTQAVRVYQANQRRGTVSTKTRGEVQGSSKKIYRQKGTGRARHGSKRAPIFVHGGLVFGPKPRDYSLKLPEKMKRKALFSALSAKVQDKNLKIIAGLEKMQPKTKAFAEVLKNLSLNGKKNILVVVPSYSDEMKSIGRAVRNIEGLSYIAAYQLNPLEVLRSRTMVCMKDAIAVMEEVFLKDK